MKRIDVAIVGGGQAGLAMSRCLVELGVDHVVLERGRIAERWRSERWDSLRLLTPNWMTRLPGLRYEGPDPDGFMTAAELVRTFEGYARSFSAPVETEISVRAIVPQDHGFELRTDRGDLGARAVVVATGHCDKPSVPALSAALPARVNQLVPSAYRNPGALPPGGVVVVGAAASGVQIAEELARAGREVTLAVGTHTRLPRVHRGHDVYWWMDAMGVLDEPRSSERPPLPSPQLIGRRDRRAIDLAALERLGVRIVGRVAAADGETVALGGNLEASVRDADERLDRLLARIDAFAASRGLASGGEPAHAPRLRRRTAPAALHLGRSGISTVVWATGFRRDHRLYPPGVVDGRGEVGSDGEQTALPGLYVLGMRDQRTRKSSFIDGVGDDARRVAARIAERLGAMRGEAA